MAAARKKRRIPEAAIHRSKITDLEERLRLIDRASSRIKTNTRLNFVRSIRGR
jgi:hypothetical protein